MFVTAQTASRSAYDNDPRNAIGSAFAIDAVTGRRPSVRQRTTISQVRGVHGMSGIATKNNDYLHDYDRYS